MKAWIRNALAGVGMALAMVGAQAASEYHVKAAILYNLMRMMEWPGEGVQTVGKPMRVCILGEDPFGDALDLIRAKKVRNRPLEFIKNIALGQAENCELLFISRSEQDRLEEILEAVHALPLLTVSDQEGFAQAGGITNLMQEEKKIRVQLNPAAAERAKMTVSPTLLKLAKVVEDEFPAKND